MADLSSWYEVVGNGVILKLQIQPKASRTEVVGTHGDPPRLKIRIAAPPVEGAANEELCRFLKKMLSIPLSRIQILRGEGSKIKDVFCVELSEEAARSLLTVVK
ncbi:MAG TPA: YggU family protein [Bdellovibrionales bacterium]|nr:MAG: YggU family protein [Bdellovibrionales bacterium GWB1_52_6]OFZ03423.1 MAG: YggU family protein [Bdellovibrionales bacterium GWA1_52_35]OFZ37794.1 MAG: YggU family protein [Bdellovibrionales bacterium GWC1_52_8]HAR43320.1 YggU family protein [Bdellovibrionales bacterium]HCM41004.1 YggU family protein [Bdellovibrionales bacterium]